MVEYIVRTDKPIRLDEILHLHGIHHYAVQRLGEHGRLVDADKLPVSTLIYNHANGVEIETLELKLVYLKHLQGAPTVLEASDNIGHIDDDAHLDEMQSDMRDYCERYEPTYNPEDGSM